MKNPNRSSVGLGLAAGVGLTVIVAAMMGQGPSNHAPTDTQYFVTADGEMAHLWLREGNTLRMVAHGECKECKEHGHGEHGHGDEHDHGRPAAGPGGGGGHSDHNHGDGSAIGTAVIGVWTVKVSGEAKPGSEAHLDIELSGSAPKPAAVRVWIGSQDGRGAMKERADGDGKSYHAHTDVPNPIPAGAKLWIEIEDARGVKAVGGFDLKK